MNPRRRRLLIPGLLVVLILVVLVVSVSRHAGGAATTPDAERLGLIDDPRVTESSGLAISTDDPDRAYTVNDSGNVAAVYTIELSSGDVVGTTTVSGVDWVDTEALALHDGTLWVADTGDNAGSRDDVALYSLDEPGPGDATASAQRHPVTLPDGPRDIESLAVDPTSGEMLLVTKRVLQGEVLRLPADPPTDRATRADAADFTTLGVATDAVWTPDGRHVVVRGYGDAEVIDPATGEVVQRLSLPEQPQGETIAVDPSGSSLVIGSEGTTSQLWRIALNLPAADAVTAAPREQSTGLDGDQVERRWLTPLISLVLLGGLVGVTVWMARRPRRRRRRR